LNAHAASVEASSMSDRASSALPCQTAPRSDRATSSIDFSASASEIGWVALLT
jgi:hypothetical protein